MKIHIIVQAYVLANEISNLLHSLNGSDVTYHLFLHSNHAAVVSVCDKWGDEPNVRYYPYGINRGLSKSVNEGIIAALAEGADAIIVPNDDILMNRSDLGRLAQACVDHRECGLVFARGMDGWPLDFHVFGINPLALSTVGYFDESFPDYFSDTDYMQRCTLLGLALHQIGKTDIVHFGSATLNRDLVSRKRIQQTYPLDQTYYIAKHGGAPGGEGFIFPFNDPELSWFIPASERSNPYPAYRRPESEMIRE